MRLTAGIALASAGLGLALGIALSDGRVQKAKTDHAADRAMWAAQLADARDQALRAEQDATQREHELTAQVEQITQEARDAQNQLRIDRAAADAAAASLRQQIAALSARTHSHPANPGACAASQRKTSALAGLLAEADSLAGESSGVADDAIRRGLACEAAYGAVRSALK